jgi:flagellar FliJ protein
MSKFIFNLDGVLTQRKHAEHQRQRELAEAQRVVAQLEAELRDVEATQASVTQDLRDNRLVGQIDLAFLAAHRRFIIATQRKGMAIVQQLANAQAKVTTARTELAEAARQKKAIEILRDKRFELWKHEQAKKETDALDEASMQLGYFHSDDRQDDHQVNR